jgi:hypothetical protein
MSTDMTTSLSVSSSCKLSGLLLCVTLSEGARVEVLSFINGHRRACTCASDGLTLAIEAERCEFAELEVRRPLSLREGALPRLLLCRKGILKGGLRAMLGLKGLNGRSVTRQCERWCEGRLIEVEASVLLEKERLSAA